MSWCTKIDKYKVWLALLPSGYVGLKHFMQTALLEKLFMTWKNFYATWRNSGIDKIRLYFNVQFSGKKVEKIYEKQFSNYLYLEIKTPSGKEVAPPYVYTVETLN